MLTPVDQLIDKLEDLDKGEMFDSPPSCLSLLALETDKISPFFPFPFPVSSLAIT